MRRLRDSRDAGVTLPELLVTMMLLGLLSAIALALVTSVTRSFTDERAATDNTMVASNGMNELTRVVRSGTALELPGVATQAPVFLDARPMTAVLYVYIDADSAAPRPMKVQFTIDGQGRLRETRWLATSTDAPWTFATSAQPTRTVATSVSTTAGALFRYFDAEGHELVVPVTGALTAAQREEIAAVRISLTVQSSASGRTEPVELRNTVSLPNLGISRIRP